MSAIRKSVAEAVFIVLSLSNSSLYLAVHAQAAARPMMSATKCSPLNGSNYQSCCIALNRSQILTPYELNQCPPLTTAAIGVANNQTGDEERSSGDRNPHSGGTNGGGDNGGGTGGGGDNGGGDHHHDHHHDRDRHGGGGGDDHHEGDQGRNK